MLLLPSGYDSQFAMENDGPTMEIDGLPGFTY